MNGEMVYFNYCWLRDNCVISWDSSRQEPTFDILDESDDLHATSAKLGNESLDIIWSDGFESRYDLRWLELWHKGCNHGDLAVRVRENWYDDHYSDMARFNYDNVMLNPPNVADWAEAMLDEGIALIQYMPNSDKGLKTLCELFGTVRPSFSGYTFDVKSKANPENLAYTNKPLELHTDLPAEELAPGI
jgi:gamma-butyrobetaine dioxygenase